ncbi:MAG: histidine kinase dimerization/phospho-acceptor domain-containing protein, partial [Flavobacteriales bacterium]
MAVYFTINTKRNEYAAFADELSAIHNRLLQSNASLQYFISGGYHNPAFYSTKRERNIDLFIDQQQQVIEELSLMKVKAQSMDATYVDEIGKLEAEQRLLNDSVKYLKILYLERGFKDHGAEGRMREAAHKIEEEGLLPEINILRLRRLEKDFLLRGESQYVDRFNAVSNDLLASATGNSLVTLQSYQSEFNRLVSAVVKIGVSGESGLLLSISNQIKASDEHFNLINELHAIEFGEIQRKYNVLLLSITIAFALFIIGLSIFLSRKLTNELKELNLRMFNFIRARFKESTEDSVASSFRPGTVEIDQLNKLFVLMKRNLKSTLHDLEKSSADAKRISEYKSQFLANMSHEMRTPLNGVIGMVSAIEKTKLDEEQTECVSIIKYSSNHLLE